MSISFPNLLHLKDSGSLFFPHKDVTENARRGKPTFVMASKNNPSHKLKVERMLDGVKWDEKGLAVAIAQDSDTGTILMQGFVNRDALRSTLDSKKATFYSRSRSSLWIKGETSGNFILVNHVFLDCDRDSLIYMGKPEGHVCHTGAETCYFSSLTDLLNPLEKQTVEHRRLASTTLYTLESKIAIRKAESENRDSSWTKQLLLDNNLLCSKIREEAEEVCRTVEEGEDGGRTASEMADLLYHSIVLLVGRGVKLEAVLKILRERFSRSGIEEKKSRGPSLNH